MGERSRAVVARPLLVAEGLEALLQPLLEGLVELLGLDAEGLLVDVVDAAADDVLAQGVEELADALLAVARLDELEGGVAEVVDERGRREASELATRESFGTWSVTAASRIIMRSRGSHSPRM